MAKALQLVNGVPRTVTIGEPTIYDQASNINSTINTGTNVPLPSGQTYDSSELEVYLNGVRLTYTYDYNYVGSVPRTQITFTFDLVSGDVVRFRIDRIP